MRYCDKQAIKSRNTAQIVRPEAFSATCYSADPLEASKTRSTTQAKSADLSFRILQHYELPAFVCVCVCVLGMCLSASKQVISVITHLVALPLYGFACIATISDNCTADDVVHGQQLLVSRSLCVLSVANRYCSPRLLLLLVSSTWRGFNKQTERRKIEFHLFARTFLF